jgi:glyoxylase-like metal-dependent hydrolase (beta-lactamase superfamily II)
VSSGFPKLILALVLGARILPATAAEVAPNIELVPGKTVAGSQPDGNSILITAPEGLIVIDTGRHPEHTQRVLDLAKATGKPIRAIINSHWHLDHVGGNVLLKRAYPGVEVYATAAIDSALNGFLTEYRAQLEDALPKAEADSTAAAAIRAEIALIDDGMQLRPTRVVAHSSQVTIAGRALELHVERSAVTAGDIWVFDPATQVLIAGDLVTLPAPFFDTACPARWQAALRTLSQKRFARLIPGHGALMDRAAFDKYHAAFDHLVTCGKDRKRSKGDCTEGWLRDASDLLPESDRAYARALVDYYVDNTFRGDPSRREAACRVRP